MIYNKIEDIIGNTPLLKVDLRPYGIEHIDAYIKLEYLNPFGSVKDRTALGLMEGVDFDEARRTGKKIIESSSGNTARALQMMANRAGIGFVSVTSRIKIPEVEKIQRYLGTEIVALPGQSECPDPNDDNNAIATIGRMIAADPEKYIYRDQYSDVRTRAMHERTTATEIFTDIDRVDAVVVGLGTGGSSGGLVDYIKHHDTQTDMYGVVSSPNDFLPGIRTRNELFETELVHTDEFDDVIEVSSQQALEALDQLVRREGVLAGPTTGGNFYALLEAARRRDGEFSASKRGAFVTIACDRLEPYMSYIEKRTPERFGNTSSRTDLYSVTVSDDERQHLEKPASRETEAWLDEAQVQCIDTRGVRPAQQFRIDGSLCYPEEILRDVLASGTPFSQKQPLLFVCPRGDRSLLYAKILRDRGYEAYSLAGGLAAWRAAGLPFVSGVKK